MMTPTTAKVVGLATGCKRRIDAKYLMCGQHWAMVPQHMRTAVWREYHSGLRTKSHPTPAYYQAVYEAQKAVRAAEAQALEATA